MGCSVSFHATVRLSDDLMKWQMGSYCKVYNIVQCRYRKCEPGIGFLEDIFEDMLKEVMAVQFCAA